MQEWFDKATGKVLSLFSHREVKTPLSFFFRIASVLITMLLAALYWVGPDPVLRFNVFEIGVVFLGALTLAVFIFAWFKPKHLVYGETGHRAELKLSMGTEKRELTTREIAHLEGTTNPESGSSSLAKVAESE
jgi:hypothetical protein